MTKKLVSKFGEVELEERVRACEHGLGLLMRGDELGGAADQVAGGQGVLQPAHGAGELLGGWAGFRVGGSRRCRVQASSWGSRGGWW